MKKVTMFTMILVIFSLSGINSFAQQRQYDKAYNSLLEKAERINSLGGFAVVGIAVADEIRPDIGEAKAIENAKGKLIAGRKNYVAASAKSFFEEIGVTNPEHNDVYQYLVEDGSEGMLEGARQKDFKSYYVNKAQKEQKVKTYLSLYVITPESLKSALEATLKQKGSKDNLYQRYVSSKYKEDHDKIIKKFDEVENK